MRDKNQGVRYNCFKVRFMRVCTATYNYSHLSFMPSKIKYHIKNASPSQLHRGPRKSISRRLNPFPIGRTEAAASEQIRQLNAQLANNEICSPRNSPKSPFGRAFYCSREIKDIDDALLSGKLSQSFVFVVNRKETLVLVAGKDRARPLEHQEVNDFGLEEWRDSGEKN